MKQFFFQAVLLAGSAAIVGYFLWKAGKALAIYFRDRRDARRAAAEAEVLRREREARNQARLDNGCDHRFGETLGGFPPFACRRCGLEQTKPTGPCDHVWRLDTESAPGAVCEKCGKRYKPIVSEQTKL
ncbi:MAG TPA: hypothetical protein ENJ16_00875 [Planctomycetaceae bacterium]|nr:hypothetical protein [Planctomycetaceae bacterium]